MSTQGVLAGASTDGFPEPPPAPTVPVPGQRALHKPRLCWCGPVTARSPGLQPPGPRVAVSIEGTRSYGIGLARDAAGPDTDAGVDAV